MWITESIKLVNDVDNLVYHRDFFFDEVKYPNTPLPDFGKWEDPTPRINDPEGVTFHKYDVLKEL